MQAVVQEQWMMHRLFPCCLALSVLGACTDFPALDRTITPQMEAAAYPALVPIEPLLAQATAGRVDAARTEASLNARLARLRNRAAALRGPLLSTSERQRLTRGTE